MLQLLVTVNDVASSLISFTLMIGTIPPKHRFSKEQHGFISQKNEFINKTRVYGQVSTGSEEYQLLNNYEHVNDLSGTIALLLNRY
jgi:hypothetical protein